jgi:(p)ppGpp synthase/HD superfamily hydrolase
VVFLQTEDDTMPAPTLEDAIRLALDAHAGQREKAGRPYILHPLRVMLRLDSELEQMAGVLHDVVEDTEISMERLRELGYPSDLLRILDLLTHREGETYEDFVERVATSPTAARVKLADLADNLDVRRLTGVTDSDAVRLTRYLNARARLRRVAHET